MKKIQTIIRKEWAEVFKNRLVLFSVIFLPLMMTALPLIMLFLTRDVGMGELSTDMPEQFGQLCSPGLTGGECFQVFMVGQFMLLFLLLPLIIPINIAAYSIVGEKTTHSLEPLLATPITTAELLTGKNLAAVVPAVIATWIGFSIFAVGAFLISSSRQLVLALLDPMWILAITLVGPLMALMSVNFSIMVSSRVNDPRAAEQISTIIILPLLLLFFGRITGIFLVDRQFILWISLVLMILDILMIYLAVRLFQRETILTRWK